MYPELIQIPLFTIVLFFAAALAALSVPRRGIGTMVLAALGGLAVGAVVAFLAGLFTPVATEPGSTPALKSVPLHSYGLMIMIGFLAGVWMAARRARLIGLEPRHCMDVGLLGIVVGLVGARIFHVAMNWRYYNPFGPDPVEPGNFHFNRILEMFMVWHGGLVFFGAFVTVLPATYLYCRKFKIPPIRFLDMAVPSLMAGQAFGRIGCFLNGCCYGKICALPWAVQFPAKSQVYRDRMLPNWFESPPVHPTQIYASIAAALTAAFLYAYWPHRRYEGQVLSWMLIMAGSTRFFEELLRGDDFAIWSSWMTIGQWFSIAIFTTGVAMLLYFRSRAAAGERKEMTAKSAA